MGWSPAHHRGTPARDELNTDGERPIVGWVVRRRQQAQLGLVTSRALSPDCQVPSYVQCGEWSLTSGADTNPSPG